MVAQTVQKTNTPPPLPPHLFPFTFSLCLCPLLHLNQRDLVPLQVPPQVGRRRQRDRDAAGAPERPPQDEIPGAEEGAVHEHDPHEPVQREAPQPGVRRHVGVPLRHGRPAGPAGMDRPVERIERLRVGRAREEGGREPDDRRKPDHRVEVQGKVRLQAGHLHPKHVEHEGRHGQPDRGQGGGHLAPRVYAPPVPAQDEDEPQPGGGGQQQAPRLGDGVQEEGDDEAQQGHPEREDPRDAHVVGLVRVGPHEAPPEVVDEVRDAPVQLRGHRAHERRQEGRKEEPEQAGRQHVLHHQDEPGARLVEVRVQHQCGQRHDDPGPGAQAEVGNRVPERGEEGVRLVLRAHHALRDVTAAARLGPWIPAGPPLHPGVRRKGQRRERKGRRPLRRPADRGQQVERLVRKLLAKARHPANLRHVEHEHGERDRAPHRHHELEQVRHHHAPEPRQQRVDGHQQDQPARHHERRAHLPPQHRKGRLPEQGEVGEEPVDHRLHRQRHPPDDEDVQQKAEKERLQAAQPRGHPAAVPEFDELHVRHDAASAPEAGKEEDGKHPPDGGVPPEPVARDAVLGHNLRHQQRRVDGKRGGHHARPGQPPGHRAARQKELRGVLAGPLVEVERDAKGEDQVGGDKKPVEACHGQERDQPGKQTERRRGRRGQAASGTGRPVRERPRRRAQGPPVDDCGSTPPSSARFRALGSVRAPSFTVLAASTVRTEDRCQLVMARRKTAAQFDVWAPPSSGLTPRSPRPFRPDGCARSFPPPRAPRFRTSSGSCGAWGQSRAREAARSRR